MSEKYCPLPGKLYIRWAGNLCNSWGNRNWMSRGLLISLNHSFCGSGSDRFAEPNVQASDGWTVSTRLAADWGHMSPLHET